MLHTHTEPVKSFWHTSPIILSIVANHAAIADETKRRIRKHRRELRAQEARSLALGLPVRK